MKQETSSEGKTLDCCQVDPAVWKLSIDFFKASNAILKKQIASTILDKKPTLSDVRRALCARSPAILLTDSYYPMKARGARAPPHLLHWIVVTGYEDEKFHINDSIHESSLKTGRMIMNGRILERAMDTYSRFGWHTVLIVIGLKASESIPCLYRVGPVE